MAAAECLDIVEDSGGGETVSDNATGQRSSSELAIVGQLSLSNTVDFGDDECLVVRLSQDKSLWAAGLASGKIQLYTQESCSLVYSLDPPDKKTKETVTSLAFVPAPSSSATVQKLGSGKMPGRRGLQLQEQQQQQPRSERKHLLLAGYATGQLRMWHYTGIASPLLWTINEGRVAADGQGEGEEPNQILCVACSPDGERCITGGADSAIRVYSLLNRQLQTMCQSSLSAQRMDGHRSHVCSLLYHPLGAQQPDAYGHIFVSGGWDDTVQIWDDRRSSSLWVYSGPHICGTDAIDIDPMHNHIVTASWQRHDSMLQVWKFKDEVANARRAGVGDFNDRPHTASEMLRTKPIGELPQDPVTGPSMGYVAQWLADQYLLFAGSNANTLKIIDRGNMNILASAGDLPRAVYSVASLVPDGSEGKKFLKLAASSGTQLFVLRFERK